MLIETDGWSLYSARSSSWNTLRVFEVLLRKRACFLISRGVNRSSKCIPHGWLLDFLLFLWFVPFLQRDIWGSTGCQRTSVCPGCSKTEHRRGRWLLYVSLSGAMHGIQAVGSCFWLRLLILYSSNTLALAILKLISRSKYLRSNDL